MVDNDDQSHVKVKGEWEILRNNMYGPSKLVTKPKRGIDQYVTFTPEIVKSGPYKVYAYFTKSENAASKTHIEVFDGRRNREVIIKKSDIMAEGQRSGEWMPLGVYNLPEGKKAYVKITTKKANGDITSDAVFFVPK